MPPQDRRIDPADPTADSTTRSPALGQDRQPKLPIRLDANRPSERLRARIYYDDGLTHPEMVILFVLSDHADHLHRTRLKRATIARWGHFAQVARVTETTHSLEAKGVLVIRRRRTYCEYAFSPVWMAIWTPADQQGKTTSGAVPRNSRSTAGVLHEVRLPYFTGEPVKKNPVRDPAAAAEYHGGEDGHARERPGAQQQQLQQKLLSTDRYPTPSARTETAAGEEPDTRRRLEALLAIIAVRTRTAGGQSGETEDELRTGLAEGRLTVGDLQRRADELQQIIDKRGPAPEPVRRYPPGDRSDLTDDEYLAWIKSGRNPEAIRRYREEH